MAIGTAMVWNPVPATAQLPPPPPPPTTLWSFMGVPQGYRWFRDNAFNRSGLRPGLERQPPLKAIADPRNLASPDAAIKKAAEVKQAEDLKKQKIKAIRYLASIGCGCYNRDGSITDAMLKAMDDCTEEVRWAAVTAISEAATGEMCANCKQKSCCSEEISKKLYQIAYEHDETGCFLEPSERVRTAASEALRVCCPGGGDEMYFESAPAPATTQPLPPEQPSVLPPAGVERPALEPVPGIPVPPVPPVPGVAPVVPPQAAAPVAPPVLSAGAPETAVTKVEPKAASEADVKTVESKPAEKPAAKIAVLPAVKTPSPRATLMTAKLAAPRELATPREPAAITAAPAKPQSQPRSEPQRSSRRTASLLATAALETSSIRKETAAAEPASIPALPTPSSAALPAQPAEPAVGSGNEETRQGVARSIHILAPASQAKPIGEVVTPEAAAEQQTPAKPTVTVRLAGTSFSGANASETSTRATHASNDQAAATFAPIVTPASMRRLQPMPGPTEQPNASPSFGSTGSVPAPSSRRSAQLPIRIGASVTR
jgi:hypothetical protein